MSKKSLIFTVIIQMVCWSCIGWVLVGGQSSIQASPLYQIPPTPFLGPIYYGQKSIVFVFDHQYPLFNGDGDANDWVRHYDGTQKDPPFPPGGYGYDSHVGIDYDLVYEPVVASATGNIAFAGWADPDNHRLSYGLHVQMTFDDNTSYRAWYGHLSTLTVETGDSITAFYDDRKRILGISCRTSIHR